MHRIMASHMQQTKQQQQQQQRLVYTWSTEGSSRKGSAPRRLLKLGLPPSIVSALAAQEGCCLLGSSLLRCCISSCTPAHDLGP